MSKWFKTKSNFDKDHNELIERAEVEAEQARDALKRQKIILQELKNEYIERQSKKGVLSG